MDKYLQAKKITENYGQQHLLSFYEELSMEDKNALLDQILSIDYDLVSSLYNMATTGEEPIQEEITPIACTDKNTLNDEKINKYIKDGMNEFKEGHFAAVTMAGGQGTRLGHNGPKGTYDIGLDNHISLFEIQCNRIKQKSMECGRNIPWYIMTSKENDAQTKEFFESNNYFGYDKNDIMFFVQCMLPMVHTNGKIVLCDKGKIKEGADGHGGIFTAMIKSGVVKDMEKRGVQWIFVGGIDNVLTRLCDPCFVGFLKNSGCLLGGKSLIKRDAYEKAGVFCKLGGKPYVVEYTEITDEMANLRDDNGQFVYGDAHILCNMFNIKVFESMGDKGLPYHVAKKKTDYIDNIGNLVKPEKPCAYKFEAFIFDAFKYFDDMAILRIKRELEFAPVKNKDGEDSPLTAKELYLNCGKDIY